MLLFILLGLGVGIISGMLGIGGGILLTPGLIWLIGVKDYRHAAGMTLAILTLPVFLPSTWKYLTSGIVPSADLRFVALVAAGVATGAYIGAHIVEQIPLEHVPKLKIAFGLILLYVGVRSLVDSNSDVAAAFYSLLAVAAAWLAYFGLRALGRRHLPRPDLAAKIEAAHEHVVDPLDYSI
ncbi:MAG: TSUP family transporter [Planctomycetes bacterium]|nr:TSUP family transporter [Planctomycetota bacterium]